MITPDAFRHGLSGPWELRFGNEQEWRGIEVPGCWEEPPAAGRRGPERPGPAWYRKTVTIPPEYAGRRVWLCFDGVSYHCTVYVDGREMGSHTGIWDAFRLDVTDAVVPGREAEITVRVEKPAGLEAGPDSPSLPGRFPLREALAGFLPYVWGSIFGGLWQDVRLEATGDVFIEEAVVRGSANGRFDADIRCSEEVAVRVEILDPDGRSVHTARCRGAEIHYRAVIEKPRLWSSASPSLYTAVCEVEGNPGSERSMTFGFRSIAFEGSTLLLNHEPAYPRMVLSWGWYPDCLASNPGEARVGSDWKALRGLGFNGVKFCLWVPPPYFFDLADRMGMLLWLELPMWLPRLTERFRGRVVAEYERIVRQVRGHPSVVLYTLGCELNREADAGFLEPLYRSVKSLVGDAPVRDNSGSGEAYGGLLDEYADFADNHFYCDLQFFRPLVDAFAPRWRKGQPWLFGEYCDFDTFRDLSRLYGRYAGEKPWWTRKDAEANPQGARWAHDIVEHEERLRKNGMWGRSRELEELSYRQALLHRKVTLEQTRACGEISGYVITGERDTPVSAPGIFDDYGGTKFDAESFRAFNGDVVLTLGWDRSRAWIRGGDRWAPRDHWSYRSGETVRAHLVCSHYGAGSAAPGAAAAGAATAQVRWRVSLAGRTPATDAVGEGAISLSEAPRPGTVREVAVAEFTAPEIAAPVRAVLEASIDTGAETSFNSWNLWFFPKGAWAGEAAFDVVDPWGRLDGLASSAPVKSSEPEAGRVLVATIWTGEIHRFLRGGGRAVVLLGVGESNGPLTVIPMPFWREAVKVVEPHPAWGDFPHERSVDLQFYSMAPDAALDTSRAARESRTVGAPRPLLRRVDARTMHVHDYAVELAVGSGRAIVSTLRLEGGLGDQALGIERNPAAAWLLRCWLRYLENPGPRGG